MFLLIRTVDTADRFIQSVFTFHNVSINTEIDAKIDEMVADFTFHNVSINTVAYGMAETAPISVFTFHNVSINTAQQNQARFTTHVFTFHNVSINTYQ